MNAATLSRPTESASLAAIVAAIASKKGKENNQVPPAYHASRSAIDGGEGTLDLLASLERVSLVLLSVHELLSSAHQEAISRLVWTAYLETALDANSIGDAMGVEVLTN